MTSSKGYGSIPKKGDSALKEGPAESATANRVKSKSECAQDSDTIVFCIHGNKYGVARCCDLMPASTKSGETTPHDLSHASNGPDGCSEHCHPPISDVDDASLKRARRKLIVASVLCLCFMVIEIVGGYLANSLAIATDAAHLLTDFSSFMVSLFALWIASRPATRSMSFGYHRAEVLGAIISILFIWVVTGILVLLAVERLFTLDFVLNPEIMLITSVIGVIINIIMGVSLHQTGHHHGHGPAQPPPVSQASVESCEQSDETDSLVANNVEDGSENVVNLNVRAAFIHVICDLLQSVGVLIASTVLYFRPEWSIIDPICTFIFSILVLGTTLKILRDTVRVLMEGTPSNISYGTVEKILLTTPHILSVHGLRIWSLSSDKTALSAHLAVENGADAQEVLKEATRLLRDQYHIYEMTLQVETFHSTMEDCNRCQPIFS